MLDTLDIYDTVKIHQEIMIVSYTVTGCSWVRHYIYLASSSRKQRVVEIDEAIVYILMLIRAILDQMWGLLSIMKRVTETNP